MVEKLFDLADSYVKDWSWKMGVCSFFVQNLMANVFHSQRFGLERIFLAVIGVGKLNLAGSMVNRTCYSNLVGAQEAHKNVEQNGCKIFSEFLIVGEQ